jgi:hypothetical protein
MVQKISNVVAAIKGRPTDGAVGQGQDGYFAYPNPPVFPAVEIAR